MQKSTLKNNLKSSILFASRILFPRAQKKSVGTKSILGAVICIALSLIPLVVVVSVSDGMIEGITERIINLSSSHIQINYDFENNIFDEKILDEDEKYISKVDSVVSTYKVINSSGLASSNSKRTGATIRAINPEIFYKNESYKNLFYATKGDIKDFYNDEIFLNENLEKENSDSQKIENSVLKNSSKINSSQKKSTQKKCLIGEGIAENLNLAPGDTIRIITTQKIKNRVVPKMTSFKVSAVISSGYQELDSLWIFIPLEVGLQILKPNNSTASLMIETTDAFSGLHKIERDINDYLAHESNCFNASIYRWDELNQSQFENFSSTKMLLVFIMILIVLVATVNISSSLVMLSMEHRKEIAILKSFGTKNSIITFAFVIVGILIGTFGVLIGIPIGILISLNVNSIISFFEIIINFFAQIGYFLVNGNLTSFHLISLMDKAYYLETIPVNLPFLQILFYSVFAILLSLLASLIPAIKAGKENPLEIFRKVGA